MRLLLTLATVISLAKCLDYDEGERAYNDTSAQPSWVTQVHSQGPEAFFKSDFFKGKTFPTSVRPPASKFVLAPSRKRQSLSSSDWSVRDNEHGKGCFVVPGGETEAQVRAYLDDRVRFFDPSIPADEMTNFLCTRRCSESGYAIAISFNGSSCRCGNERFDVRADYSQCRSRCTGAAESMASCYGAYCCGSGWNGTALHAVFMMVGNIPVERIIARQVAEGVREKYAKFSKRWASVSAVASVDFSQSPGDGRLGLVAIAFQGTRGKAHVLRNDGSLGPWLENMTYYSRKKGGSGLDSFFAFNFGVGTDVSEVIGNGTLACAFHTTLPCIASGQQGASPDAQLLWLVRGDGSYNVLIKEPPTQLTDFPLTRWLSFVSDQLPTETFFRESSFWSWNPAIPSRNFPRRITACTAAPSSRFTQDHYSIFLFDSLGQVWTAFTSVVEVSGRTPNSILGPTLIGANPRTLGAVWGSLASATNLRPELAVNFNRRPNANRVCRYDGSVPVLEPITSSVALRDGNRLLDISGSRQEIVDRFFTDLASNDVSRPIPLDELSFEFVVRSPLESTAFVCNASIVRPTDLACLPASEPTTVGLLTRSYTQGEAENIRTSVAPGEPDENTYAISLVNPAPTDTSLPAPSQMMSKTVESSSTTSFQWSVETGVSITIGAKVTSSVEGGVPFVASGKAEVEKSIEAQVSVSFGFSALYAQTYTEGYQVTLEAPAGTCVQLKMGNELRSADVPWSATFESRGFVRVFQQRPPLNGVPFSRLSVQELALEEVVPQEDRIFHTFGELEYRQQLVKQARVFRLRAQDCLQR